VLPAEFISPRSPAGSRPTAPAGARAPSIDLLFVIAPNSMLLDIAGPAEAFRLAICIAPRAGCRRGIACASAARWRRPPTSVGLALD